MSLHHNPRIVTDGLVFAYDMDNVKKSFKGKPTTNIITSQGISGAQGITYTYVTDEDGWSKYSISGTWASGTYPWSCRINSATFTGGVAYSARFLVKTNVREKYATFPDTTTGIYYVNDGNMTAGGTKSSTSLGYDKNGLEITDVRNDGFIYSTGFANPTTSQVGYFHSRPLQDGTTFNSSTDFIWVKEIQVEEGSFTTPFVDGTRSNTQALLDMSKSKNTVTATSLTYNSDGTFEFDGTSDYITIPEPNVGLSPNSWTIEGWINPENQRSFFINPNSNGIDNFLEYDNTNKRIAVKVCESADTNERYFYSDSQSVPLNTWSHFSASISNLNVKLYINGANHVDQTETISMSDWSGIWHIGRRANGTFYLDGSLSNIKIYNRALTAAEIKQNLNATRARYGV